MASVAVTAILAALACLPPASAQQCAPQPGISLPSVPAQDAAPSAQTRAQPDSQQPNQKRRRRPIFIGPDLGVYLPGSAKVRSRFGGAWPEFGIRAPTHY